MISTEISPVSGSAATLAGENQPAEVAPHRRQTTNLAFYFDYNDTSLITKQNHNNIFLIENM